VCADVAQGFFTSGYFLEDKETDAPNYLKSFERKKILSNVESLGLLSAAEKAGLSLSKVSYFQLQLHMLKESLQADLCFSIAAVCGRSLIHRT